MITASIVTYDHHLLDIEPVLRSIFASPIDCVWVIDHSEHMMRLEEELNEFTGRVLTGEPLLKEKVDNGFRIIYLRHENNGYGGGHNVALKAATQLGSKYHLVVNPDVWFGPRVIPELVKYMDAHEDVGQIMPKVLYPDGTLQPLARMLPTPYDLLERFLLPPYILGRCGRNIELSQLDLQMTLNIPFLSGCFMFLRISAIKEIGMFDERFFLYAEDIDFSRRIHAKYKTIYYPEVPVYHKFSRASHRSVRLLFIHFISLAKYFNKWGWFTDKERIKFNNHLQQQIAGGGIK